MAVQAGANKLTYLLHLLYYLLAYLLVYLVTFFVGFNKEMIGRTGRLHPTTDDRDHPTSTTQKVLRVSVR